MVLSKTQRELISRGAALFLGLLLCYASVRCLIWVYRLATDPVLEEMRSSGTQRKPVPFVGPLVLGSLLGIGGIAFTGFALLPTRVIYSLNPMHDRTDLDDLGD